jgi:hypothetical protein
MARQDKAQIILEAVGAAKVVGALEGVERTFRGLTGAFGALASVNALGQFFGQAIKEAAESEKSYTRLAASMQRLGMNYSVLRLDVERFTEKMKNSSAITDEQAADALNRLIKVTNDLSLAQLGVQAAADLSADGTVEFESAISALTRSALGGVEMFKRYGVRISENIPKGEEFETVVKNINAQFGGTALTNIGTTAGKLDQLGKAWKDFQESAGRVVTAGGDGGVLGGITRYLNNLATALDSGKSKLLLFGQIFASEMIRWGSSSKLLAIIAKEQEDMAASWARNMKAMFPDAGKGTGGGTGTAPITMEQLAEKYPDIKALLEIGHGGRLEILAKQARERLDAAIGFVSQLEGNQKLTGGPKSVTMARAEESKSYLIAVNQATSEFLQAQSAANERFLEETKRQAEQAAQDISQFVTPLTDAFVDGLMGMSVDAEAIIKNMVSMILKQLARLLIFKGLLSLFAPGLVAGISSGGPTGAGFVDALSPSFAGGLIRSTGASTSLGAPTYQITVNGGAYAEETARVIVQTIDKVSRYGGFTNVPQNGQRSTGFSRSKAWNVGLA